MGVTAPREAGPGGSGGEEGLGEGCGPLVLFERHKRGHDCSAIGSRTVQRLAHRRPRMAHGCLRGAPKMENPKPGAPGCRTKLVTGRRRAGFLLLPQPCPSQSAPRRTHLESEIMLLQPVLLGLLGLDALLDGVTPVLSQLRGHLPQLILMRTQLLLLQRQVLGWEAPLSRRHRRGSKPVVLDLLQQGKLRPGQGPQVCGRPEGVPLHPPPPCLAFTGISPLR